MIVHSKISNFPKASGKVTFRQLVKVNVKPHLTMCQLHRTKSFSKRQAAFLHRGRVIDGDFHIFRALLDLAGCQRSQMLIPSKCFSLSLKFLGIVIESFWMYQHESLINYKTPIFWRQQTKHLGLENTFPGSHPTWKPVEISKVLAPLAAQPMAFPNLAVAFADWQPIVLNIFEPFIELKFQLPKKSEIGFGIPDFLSQRIEALQIRRKTRFLIQGLFPEIDPYLRRTPWAVVNNKISQLVELFLCRTGLWFSVVINLPIVGWQPKKKTCKSRHWPSPPHWNSPLAPLSVFPRLFRIKMSRLFVAGCTMPGSIFCFWRLLLSCFVNRPQVSCALPTLVCSLVAITSSGLITTPKPSLIGPSLSQCDTLYMLYVRRRTDKHPWIKLVEVLLVTHSCMITKYTANIFQ